ncbi:hypothetical protein H2200_011861 [Cladophialophora chaetospira]|uniref:Zn(2)-C6 fungal-type domain-containing protein n=1 Tax=Cladophialophora chaetospira TaxID=386627 RepID=A0AA38WYV9_9EURO|nr:hypothetical protein H2200_011861 [Cladophialophora chaetospira]
MSAERYKRNVRPPPRLRVKTGCQTCLKRRKKCPEERPVCSTCERLHLECVYKDATPATTPDAVHPSPSSTEVVSNATESVTRPPALTMSISIQPQGLRTERDWNVFHYCSTKYMKMITSPEALSKYRDLSFVFAIGYDKPWVIHAVLAPAALHASFSALIPKEEADFYSSPYSAGLTHYQAISQILEAQFSNSPKLDLKYLSVLQLTLLDATLYHLSTRLILEKDVHAIWNAFPASTISKYIDACESESKDAQSASPILPVLGKTPPALFVQILHLTWLSRQLPWDGEEQHRHALQCLTELDRIQENYHSVRLDNAALLSAGMKSAPRNSDIAAKLYFIATQMFAAKVFDPNGVSSSSPHIQTLLRQAGTLVEMFDTSVPCGQFVCWPLLILGCAACSTTFYEAAQDLARDDDELHRFQMRGVIQEMLSQIWSISYSGYVQRTLGALEKIWNLPICLRSGPDSDYLQDHGAEYDGLNALVHKDGLGAAFLLADDG